VTRSSGSESGRPLVVCSRDRTTSVQARIRWRSSAMLSGRADLVAIRRLLDAG
jgi:hypothetical protein